MVEHCTIDAYKVRCCRVLHCISILKTLHNSLVLYIFTGDAEDPGQVYYWGPFFILKKVTLNYYIIQPKVDKSSRGQMDNSLMRTLLPIS